ncbi:MAG: hypothetical protein ACFFG0_00875 [Candidatus Thorarchaeota archaeon]
MGVRGSPSQPNFKLRKEKMTTVNNSFSCYFCYGSTYLCKVQHYYKVCPCSTCLVKVMCKKICREHYEFKRKFGFSLEKIEVEETMNDKGV